MSFKRLIGQTIPPLKQSLVKNHWRVGPDRPGAMLPNTSPQDFAFGWGLWPHISLRLESK
jgi:hypothetical protein